MEDLVVKRNEVVKASYRLSPNEQAIILTALSKIDNQITDQVFYDIYFQDLVDMTTTIIKNAYRDFKEAALSLYRRELMLCNGRKKLTRWVQTVDYEDGSGTIKLRFSHEILPYLTNIKENFTAYNLRYVAKFKSTYGVRIYELLKQWQNTKQQIEISVAELKDIFQLENKYERMDSLKKKVIESALKDINNYSDLEVSYENIKKGRKIVGFKFIFHSKTTSSTNVTKEYIEHNARPGETYDQARSRLKKEAQIT